jgi:hypothetical protein
LTACALQAVGDPQFGVSQVTRERESGELVSLGDDLKAAATDSLVSGHPIISTCGH